VDSIFSVNAPFFHTLKLLFINPGKMLREYLDGKRKSYYKPVAFFLLMTFLYLVIRALIDYDPFINNTIAVEDNSQRQLLTKARDFMLLNIDKLLFVFVFTMALLLKVFFYKKRTLAEFTVISFYLIAVYTIFSTLNMLFIQYVSREFQFLAVLAMLPYFLFTLISFFQKRKFMVFLKAMIIFFLGFFSYAFIAYSISLLIIYLKNI
jgi:hypothetical protein